MKKRQTVELNFNIPRSEMITFELDEEDSKKLIEYIKQGLECQVFFPDYEDE